jgi:pyruvate dehydrogenase E1 component beta subunit
MDTILNSVNKTGRCVIIHEAPRCCSVGAEIAANIAEFALTSLLAPIKRVSGYDTIMPLYQLEDHYMPHEADILKAVHEVMEYA